MPGWARKILLVSALAAAGGCARRDAPYRFRGPLVTSVRAPELRPSVRRAAGQQTTAVVEIGELPAPPPSAGPLVDALRARVGDRLADTTGLEAAVALVGQLGVELGAAIAPCSDGPCLAQLADERGATTTTALTGDLVVFDRVVDDRAASLVGVVVTRDDRGTVEFVYLLGGVLRRGFVTPDRPREKRDQQGAILNTFVRPYRPGDSPQARYLAGELLHGFVAVDRIIR